MIYDHQIQFIVPTMLYFIIGIGTGALGMYLYCCTLLKALEGDTNV